MGPAVDHVEGVELGDGGRDAVDGHGVVAFNEQGGVGEHKHDHVVDAVQVVEGVEQSPVLPTYLYLHPRNLGVDVRKILPNDEGKLFVLVQGSRQVEVDGHGVVTQGVQVGVHYLGEGYVLQACDGGGEDPDPGLNHELDGGVVKVEGHALGDGGAVDADTVDNEGELSGGVELPARHCCSHVLVIR